MEALLLGQPAVDDEPDARDRDRRLGDVGREDDLALVRGCGHERFRLFGGGQLGVQRCDSDLWAGRREGERLVRWTERGR